MARAALVARSGNRSLSLNFESNIDEVDAAFSNVGRNVVPRATVAALNATVYEARQSETKRLAAAFDRPTPFTRKAVLYRKASHSRQLYVAELFIRDEAAKGNPPSRYLRPQIEGGPRRAKPFEVRLRRFGIMRPDEYAVPATGFRRDAYGNVPGSVIVSILAQLRAFTDTGQNETRASKIRRKAKVKRPRTRYFVPRSTWRSDRGIGGLPRGIYERGKDGRPRAVLLFVRQPTYRERYPFGEAARTKAMRVFPAHFARYFVELAGPTQG